MGEENNNKNNQNNDTNGSNNNNSNQNNNQQNSGNGKQYTEQELELLLAQKRVSAKNEFLKSLGFDGDEDGLKETLKRVMEEDEKNQTDLQKANAEVTKLTKTLKEEQRLRTEAESKLAALKLGAKPETVDDLVILASAKVTDKEDLEKVINSLKTVYPVYFVEDNNSEGEENNDPGTKGRINNNNVNNNKNNNKSKEGNKNNQNNNGDEGSGDSSSKSLAERLLANRMQSKKSSYFKHK